MTELWTDLTGDTRSFAVIEDEARREVLDGGLRPDLERLVRLVERHLDVGSDDHRPVDVDELRGALIELTIGVHRYRTYLPDDAASATELTAARERAVAARPDLSDSIDRMVELIRSVPAVATRWEQLTSPTMAKGAEDRAFYRYLRLPSLCEVGGAPGEFSTPVDEFHRHQTDVQTLMPMTMLAGTTHDTKRSEGVRARSLALAEIAEQWTSVVRRWMRDHDDHGLDAATVLLALHTAVTAWPIAADRMSEYLVKSSREADLHTSWTDPDETYEAALGALAADLEAELGLDPDDPVLVGIVNRTLRPGWANSLALLAVRLTSPGVPDLYQGTVSFTYSLVDPDNRVEPDWDERRSLVAAAADLDGPGAWSADDVDDVEAAKAVVITRTLALRRRRAEAFGAEAGYLPLAVTGAHAERVLAFARLAPGGEPIVVTVVATGTVDAWHDTSVALPSGTWRTVLADDAAVCAGGGSVPVARWLDAFPVAVLDRTDA